MADRDKKPEIVVSAAASLMDALLEIKAMYEVETDVNLTFNFAGSGKLAQQIEQGATADVFISANKHWMDSLAGAGLIEEETIVTVVKNKLALIAPIASTLTYETFEQINATDMAQIAIGNPESVPAGEYTRIALQKIGVWNDIKERSILAKDVRQVLTYVTSGNVDLGFVYQSDAKSEEQVKVLATYEDGDMQITFPGAVLKTSKHQAEAGAFLDFLLSGKGQGIFEKHGFIQAPGDQL